MLPKQSRTSALALGMAGASVLAALISLVVTVMGFCGGLVMSAVKRDRGVKDWGTMVDGHGGVLDRVDSLCFAAPVFFHIVRCGWVA